MPAEIRINNVIRQYFDLRRVIRARHIAIPSLLRYAKPGEQIECSDTGEAEDFSLVRELTVPCKDTLPAKIYPTQHFSRESIETVDGEILDCLTLLADKLPDEFLKKVLILFLAIETKDLETAKHCARVCLTSAKVGELCGLNKEEQMELIIGAVLHDIGKLFFPDSLFSNSDALSTRELEITRKHPGQGLVIIKEQALDYMPGIVHSVRSHHENIDGEGYPDGLKGGRIPISGRIVKLTDSYDAMTCGRSYQLSIALDEALDRIHNSRNITFDPDLVQLLESLVQQKPVKLQEVKT